MTADSRPMDMSFSELMGYIEPMEEDIKQLKARVHKLETTLKHKSMKIYYNKSPECGEPGHVLCDKCCSSIEEDEDE